MNFLTLCIEQRKDNAPFEGNQEQQFDKNQEQQFEEETQ